MNNKSEEQRIFNWTTRVNMRVKTRISAIIEVRFYEIDAMLLIILLCY